MSKKACLRCGEIFYPSDNRRVFCDDCVKWGRENCITLIRCKVCGKYFEKPYTRSGHRNTRTICSEACQRIWEQRPNVKEHTNNVQRGRKKALPLHRVCHDCGKPCSDYRCEECRAKWKRKYKVGDVLIDESWAEVGFD